jgi:hypothetical protein
VAHPGFEPVEEQHVPAEPAKTEKVLQEHPGVPALSGFLGQRTGNGDRSPHISPAG